MYSRFSLVLVVNHACNLRCRYCYTGAKLSRAMPEQISLKAIERAVASTRPGGTLELGFFGGEPLLEPDLIARFLQHARMAADAAGLHLQISMTTNGTLASGKAWEILTLPDLDLAVSHDGLPEVHDRHRRSADGHGTSATVEATMCKLMAAEKFFRVVTVVRPDSVQMLPEGVEYLRSLGVRSVEPSLDLWTQWSSEDGPRLEEAIVRCAQIWRAALPRFTLSWFDEKLARLAKVPSTETARCGFGDGQIAVAPSGNLYPCERLVGEDLATNPMRLRGHALEGDDFLGSVAAQERCADECSDCPLQSLCGTTCRCSNYVRTGQVGEPDGLLCLLEQVCLRETAKVLREMQQPVLQSCV